MRNFGYYRILLVAMLLMATTHSHAAILTSDLQLWLKADSIQGVGNGGGISIWDDSSSYNRNASAYRAAPTLQTNALNGQPVVNFNGLNSFAIPDSNAWDLNDFTIYSVISVNPKVRGDDWWSGIYLAHDDGSGPYNKWFAYVGYDRGSNANMGFEATSSSIGGGASFANPLPDSQFGVFEIQKSGSSYSAWINGNLIGSVSSNTFVPTSSAPLTIGFAECVYDLNCLADSGFKGNIAELMIYNTAIDMGQRQETGLYLSQKYGISSSYVVPTPAAAWLFGPALAGLGFFGKRRKIL